MSPFELPLLPYPQDALASVISPQTMSYHYGKHHKAYVEKLNTLVKGTPFAEMGLPQIIQETAHHEDQKALFNNAAQAWNHTFFWNSMSPRSARRPTGDLENAMDRTFGSLDEFKKQFKQAAMDQFGSGWIWLCRDQFGKVQITKSSNALNPLTMALKPLITVDVWEHAYYLDFQNQREAFVDGVLERLINWEFAEQNFEEP